MNYFLFAITMQFVFAINGNVFSQEVTAKDKIIELCNQLKDQTGGTMGYPYWENTIIKNDPAKSIIEISKHNLPVVISTLREYSQNQSPTLNCYHSGRGGPSLLYNIGDIACYILVQIHDDEALEIVKNEIIRRSNNSENTNALIWAMDNYIKN